MIISEYPTYKSGKFKGNVRFTNKLSVLVRCDKCGAEFKRRFKSAYDESVNLCRSCKSTKIVKLKPTDNQYWLDKGYLEHSVPFKIKWFNENKNKITINNSSTNPTHKSFWLNRGFTELEATIQIKIRNKGSVEYWTDRGYSTTDALINSKEYSQKSNNRTIKYWLNKGFSQKDAEINLNKELNKLKELCSFKRENNRYCSEYWTRKGFSEEDAVIKISEVQKSLNKDYEKIQRKRKITQDKQPQEYFDKINKKISEAHTGTLKYKSPIHKEYWQLKGFSLDESKLKAKESRFLKNKNGATTSKLEIRFLNELSNYLNIEIERNRYITVNGDVLCPDGKYKKYIFEFNGHGVHLDDRFFNNKSINPFGRDFKTVKARDQYKTYTYIKGGYFVFTAWEYDFKKNKERLFKTIKDILNKNNTITEKQWDSMCFGQSTGK